MIGIALTFKRFGYRQNDRCNLMVELRGRWPWFRMRVLRLPYRPPLKLNEVLARHWRVATYGRRYETGEPVVERVLLLIKVGRTAP